MAKALTDIGIQKLKPAAVRQEIPDRTPLLYLVLQPTGRRRFVLRYRLDGRSRKVTLPAGMSLAAARKAAGDAALDLANGVDPGEARKAAKAKAAAARADTVAAIAGQYLAREGGKLRTRRQRELLIAKHILPPFGDRAIGSIRRGEVVRLLDRVEDRSGSRRADTVLSALRRLFGWWAIRDEAFVPPLVAGMGRYSITANARKRILSDDELRMIWKSAPEGVFADYLKFLLLTAARRDEAAAMTWDEVDGNVWTLPSARNKTKVELTRPLSASAAAIVKAQPRIAGVPFVFTAGERPLRGTWRMKAALDAASGVGNWVIHDLRRTARSLMSRAGVGVDVGERCLGHVVGGVRGVYDRHGYQTEMRDAFERLAGLIERLVESQENVVALRK